MYIDLLGEPFASKDTRLSLTRKVQKQLLNEAHARWPYEYSALLYGREAAICGHLAMPASNHGRHSFSWDGPDFLQALKQIRQARMQWLGVLHSHPHTPPIPSSHDAAGWHYPSLSYWIIGMQTPATPLWRVYEWVDGEFAARSYTVSDDSE